MQVSKPRKTRVAAGIWRNQAGTLVTWNQFKSTRSSVAMLPNSLVVRRLGDMDPVCCRRHDDRASNSEKCLILFSFLLQDDWVSRLKRFLRQLFQLSWCWHEKTGKPCLTSCYLCCYSTAENGRDLSGAGGRKKTVSSLFVFRSLLWKLPADCRIKRRSGSQKAASVSTQPTERKPGDLAEKATNHAALTNTSDFFHNKKTFQQSSRPSGNHNVCVEQRSSCSRLSGRQSFWNPLLMKPRIKVALVERPPGWLLRSWKKRKNTGRSAGRPVVFPGFASVGRSCGPHRPYLTFYFVFISWRFFQGRVLVWNLSWHNLVWMCKYILMQPHNAGACWWHFNFVSSSNLILKVLAVMSVEHCGKLVIIM